MDSQIPSLLSLFISYYYYLDYFDAQAIQDLTNNIQQDFWAN